MTCSTRRPIKRELLVIASAATVLLGMIIRFRLGVRSLVERKPMSSTVPSLEPILTASPTLNG